MDYSALAKQFGAVSQPAKSPKWVEGLSPKDQAKLNMELYEEGRKRLAALDDRISSAGDVMSELEQFGELNRRARTGGVWENILPGTPLLHGSEENQMRAIQSRLGPSQREPGSGASSDTDVKLFLGGLPSITQKGNTNRDIRMQFKQKFDYAVNKRNAMQRYLNENGNLNGFDEFWDKNANAKKTTTKTPTGTFKDPFSVTNDEDYNAVPKGKYYKAPDGSVRQRK